MILGFALGLGSLGSAFENGVWNTCEITKSVALLVIPIGIMAQVGVSIINYFTGREQSWRLSNVFQSIVIFFFVASYVPVMQSLSNTIVGIENYIREKGNVSLLQVMDNATNLRFDDQTDAKDLRRRIANNDTTAVSLKKKMDNAQQSKSFYTKVTEYATGFVKSFTVDIWATMINSVSRGITLILRIILHVLAVLLISVLLIVGPLAAMVHCIPIIGHGALKLWFKHFLTYSFWGITMAAIDILMDQYLNSVTANDPSINILEVYATGVGLTPIINLCFIILFIMTPKITSWYLAGHSDSGLSAMIAAGTTVATVGSGAAKVAGAMGSGGMSAGAGMLGSMFGGGGPVQGAQMLQTFNTMNKTLGAIQQQLNKQNQTSTKQ